MIIIAIKYAVAIIMGFLAVCLLRVAYDLFTHGEEDIARRRNPSNWETRLVGMYVDKSGAVRFKTKKVYIGDRFMH